METKRICPQCEKPLPSDAPMGFCPECLVQAGFPTQAGTVGGSAAPPGFAAPSVEEMAALFPGLEILGLIGQGGMGAVYKARQKELDRLVVLKILPPQIGVDPAFAARFAREARALAQLNHPGLVTLHEFGQAGGMRYFLMEYVDGVNLRQLLHGSRVSPREALAIVPQICDALQFAHDHGTVHRDIKPENILIDRRGRVKVADFGLAKLVGAASEAGREGGTVPGSSALTESGKIMGTPRYMAPEQLENPSEVDHRADIYALGVVFYQMLTGELPDKRLEAPSKRVQIDARLDEVVLRALEREPGLRYQQASALKTRVETIAADTENRTAKRWGPESGRRGMNPQVTGMEYRSQTTLFGLPLVHVATGIDPETGRKRIARGIIAIGDIAQGVVACGGLAMGGAAFGGCAIGVLSFGGSSLGVFAVGGMSVALLVALGGAAIAPIAVGGGAVGYMAFGGKGLGAHVLDAATNDPAARQFFLPWASSLLTNIHWLVLAFLGIVLPIVIVLPIWLLRRSKAALPAGDATGDRARKGD